MSTIANNRGQGLIEYLILVALMAIASIGILRALNQAVNARMAAVVMSIKAGKQVKAKVDEVDESLYRKKDLSDFMNGAAGKKSGDYDNE